MKKWVLTIMPALALLLTALLMSPVQAENWSTPTPILYMENTISGLSMSADGNRITFSANVNGTPEIFVADWDGTGIKQLTNGSRHNSLLSISSDGSIITFMSCVATEYSWGEVQEDFKGFVINSDGTGLKQIPENNEGSCSYLSISDEGKKIAFLNGYHEICIINSDGTGLERLTNPTVLWGDVPTISRDASKVVFIGYINSEYELFVVNSDGTDLTQITDGTGKGNGCGPCISGDGKTIAYRDWIPNNGTLWLTSFNDSTELWSKPTPILTIGYTISEICITADGNRIFFTTRDDYASGDQNSDRIFTVKSDGTGLAELRSGPAGSSSFLTISGDGNKIAFIDYESNGIFVSVDLDMGLNVPVPATPLSTPSQSLNPTPSPTPEPKPTLTPTLTPTPSISPSPVTSPPSSPTATTNPSPTPDPARRTESFPTLATASVSLATVIVGIGLFVYLKKRRKNKNP